MSELSKKPYNLFSIDGVDRIELWYCDVTSKVEYRAFRDDVLVGIKKTNHWSEQTSLLSIFGCSNYDNKTHLNLLIDKIKFDGEHKRGKK